MHHVVHYGGVCAFLCFVAICHGCEDYDPTCDQSSVHPIDRPPKSSTDVDGDCWDDAAESNCLHDLSRDEDRYPGGPEIPDNLEDDNCDGRIDECTDTNDCDGDGVTKADGDCEDENSNVAPKAFWAKPVEVDCGAAGEAVIAIATTACGKPTIIPYLTQFPATDPDFTVVTEEDAATREMKVSLRCNGPAGTLAMAAMVLPPQASGVKRFAYEDTKLVTSASGCDASPAAFPSIDSSSPVALQIPAIMEWKLGGQNSSGHSRWEMFPGNELFVGGGAGDAVTVRLHTLGMSAEDIKESFFECVDTPDQFSFSLKPSRGTVHVPFVWVSRFGDQASLCDQKLSCQQAGSEHGFKVEITDAGPHFNFNVINETASATGSLVFRAFVLGFP